MSWSIETSVHANATHDALLAELEDGDDLAVEEAAMRAAMILTNFVGDPAVDESVDVALSGDGSTVSVTVTAVPTEPREATPNELGTVGDENIEVVLDEAQERAESFDDTKMHAQYEATGSLLPDEEHPKVEVFEPAPEDAGLSAEAPFDPGDFKANEITEEELAACSVQQLAALRDLEVAGQNRKVVLAKIDGAVASKDTA